jgi:hypothetical protein
VKEDRNERLHTVGLSLHCFGLNMKTQKVHLLKDWFPVGGVIERGLDHEGANLINVLTH